MSSLVSFRTLDLPFHFSVFTFVFSVLCSLFAPKQTTCCLSLVSRFLSSSRPARRLYAANVMMVVVVLLVLSSKPRRELEARHDHRHLLRSGQQYNTGRRIVFAFHLVEPTNKQTNPSRPQIYLPAAITTTVIDSRRSLRLLRRAQRKSSLQFGELRATSGGQSKPPLDR